MAVRYGALNSRVARSAAVMLLGGLDDRHADGHVFRRPHLGPRPPFRTNRLNRKAVTEERVVARLVQPARRQFEAGRVRPAGMADFHERP